MPSRFSLQASVLLVLAGVLIWNSPPLFRVRDLQASLLAEVTEQRGEDAATGISGQPLAVFIQGNGLIPSGTDVYFMCSTVLRSATVSGTATQTSSGGPRVTIPNTVTATLYEFSPGMIEWALFATGAANAFPGKLQSFGPGSSDTQTIPTIIGKRLYYIYSDTLLNLDCARGLSVQSASAEECASRPASCSTHALPMQKGCRVDFGRKGRDGCPLNPCGEIVCENPQPPTCGNGVCDADDQRNCPADCKGGSLTTIAACDTGYSCQTTGANAGRQCCPDCAVGPNATCRLACKKPLPDGQTCAASGMPMAPFCGDGICQNNELGTNESRSCDPVYDPESGTSVGCPKLIQCPQDCDEGPPVKQPPATVGFRCGNNVCEASNESSETDTCPADCKPGNPRISTQSFDCADRNFPLCTVDARPQESNNWQPVYCPAGKKKVDAPAGKGTSCLREGDMMGTCYRCDTVGVKLSTPVCGNGICEAGEQGCGALRACPPEMTPEQCQSFQQCNWCQQDCPNPPM